MQVQICSFDIVLLGIEVCNHIGNDIADCTEYMKMFAPPDQLTHPMVNPIAGLMNSVEYACREPATGIAAASSPRQLVIRYITIAPPGPAVEITSPEFKNRPVPMVPPTLTIMAELVLMVRFRPMLVSITRSMEVFFSVFYLLL